MSAVMSSALRVLLVASLLPVLLQVRCMDDPPSLMSVFDAGVRRLSGSGDDGAASHHHSRRAEQQHHHHHQRSSSPSKQATTAEVADRLRGSRETAGGRGISSSSSSYDPLRPNGKAHVPHHPASPAAGSSLGVEAFLSKIAVLIFFLLILLGFFIHVYCCHKTSGPEGSYGRVERRSINGNVHANNPADHPQTPRNSIRHHHHHHHHQQQPPGAGRREAITGSGIFTITSIRAPLPSPAIFAAYNDDKPPSYEEATGIREYDSPPPKYSRLFEHHETTGSASWGRSSLPSSSDDGDDSIAAGSLSATTSTSFLTPSSTRESLGHTSVTREAAEYVLQLEGADAPADEEGAYSNAGFVSDAGGAEDEAGLLPMTPRRRPTENPPSSSSSPLVFRTGAESEADEQDVVMGTASPEDDDDAAAADPDDVEFDEPLRCDCDEAREHVDVSVHVLADDGSDSLTALPASSRDDDANVEVSLCCSDQPPTVTARLSS